MAIGDKKIAVTVIVVVKKLCTPPAHKTGYSTHPEGAGLITERFVVIVAVKGIHFPIHVCDHQILPAVLIVIGRVDAHARTGAAILAVSNVGVEANLVKLTVTAVHKEKISDCVIGNE